MPSYNTLAVVIRRLNYSETDKILTLYSRDRGRFSAIAKGARKTISRLSGATEILTCATFNLATGKSMDVVAQAEVTESFSHLRQDLSRLAHGLYLADLVDHSVEDHEPNPVLFDLLIAGLHLVEVAPITEVAARWFELQVLQDLGYQPNLYECGVCQCDVLASVDAVGNRRLALSAAQGCVLCTDHARPGLIDDHSPLTPGGLELLQDLDRIGVEDSDLVQSVDVPSGNSLDQANLAVRRYLRYRLERELKSLAFLDSLRHTST